MAKERIINLQETKGSFQLKGKISGTEKENWYKEITTKSGKQMRISNFGIEYNEGKTIYVNLQGMERDEVFFYKRPEEKGQKGITERVPWRDRKAFNREGFRMLGINVGVKKVVDKDGKIVNDKKVLVEFDACDEIRSNLKDGDSVFVRGNIDYSSFLDSEGNKRVSTKLVPTQISLCKEVDFDAEDYVQQNDFNQTIIFMGIEKELDDNKKETGRAIVSAKVVTYGNIEDVEYIIKDSKLAALFKKNLKKYWSINVSGHMEATILTETVNDEDSWGEADAMERVASPVKREYIITGAKPSTIDKELYSEESIDEAYNAISISQRATDDYNAKSKTNWGMDVNIDSEDDEDEAW